VDTIEAAALKGKPGAKSERLQTVVRAALRVVEQEIADAGIKTTFHTKSPVKVNVDTLLIVGALVNLLSNAIEAMRGAEGTKVLTVLTGLSPDKAFAQVQINNSFPNVTAAQITQWFEHKYTTKDRHHHLGLGLPLAKKVIENSGGRFRMSPHADGGVSAVIWLPVTGSSARPQSNGDRP
jgi:C4-dicarboxylate-specific signal transduction histidine kinase